MYVSSSFGIIEKKERKKQGIKAATGHPRREREKRKHGRGLVLLT